MWKTASPLQWGIFKRKQICSSCKRFLMKCFIISVTRSATLLMCCITLSYKLVILSCTVDAAGDERVSESQKTESVWGVAKWSSRVYRQLSEVRHFNLLLFWKCAATLFFLQWNDINMVAVLGLIPFSRPGVTCRPPSLGRWMKFVTTALLQLWDATSTQHLAPQSRLHSAAPTIIFRYIRLILPSV